MIEVVIAAIVTALTSFGTGVATFLNSFITELIFVTGVDGAVVLSAFGAWSLGFMGLSLVIGLGAFVVHMCRKK